MAIPPALIQSGHTALVMNECQRMVVGDLSTFPQIAASAAPALGNLGRLAAAARSADVQVIHCVVKNRTDGRGANTNNRMAGQARRARESGQWTPVDPEAGAEIVPEIGVAPEDIVLARMHGMSPMSDAGLDAVLRNLGVTTVVAGGISLNVGVTNLAMDAMNRGYDVVVVGDACSAIPTEYGQAMLENTISLIARVATTDEIVDLWSSGAG